MIPQTALVVGAGASVPFGLPTGNDLKAAILDSSLRYQASKLMIPQTGKSSSLDVELAQFAEAFRKSDAPTIDAFLEAKRRWTDVGKMLIAAILLPKEADYLKSINNGWNWISWLFNQCDNHCWTNPNWPVSIITFNYDRIIEFAFRDMLCTRTNLPIHKAASVIRDAPIVHVYGSFRHPTDTFESLLSLDSETDNLWPNGIDYPNVRASAHGIRIINEERDMADASDDDQNTVAKRIQIAQKYLSNASRVVFLGFGFDRVNMARLGISPNGDWVNRPAPKSYCTAYGLEGTERYVPTRLAFPGQGPSYTDNMDQRSKTFPVGEQEDDCLFFLRSRLTNFLR